MTLKVLQDFCRRKRGASAEEKTGRFKSLVKSPAGTSVQQHLDNITESSQPYLPRRALADTSKPDEWDGKGKQFHFSNIKMARVHQEEGRVDQLQSCCFFPKTKEDKFEPLGASNMTLPKTKNQASLDLGLEEEEEEEEEEGGYQQGPRETTEEPQCSNADCVAQRRRWQQFVMEEERRAELLKEELRKLRGMHRKLAKEINRLSKTPFKTKRREMYNNLMVRLSPLQSSFKASRRALRAARRAALKMFYDSVYFSA